eukprot:Skav209144  [mRNA]  locus=scaffold2337:18828:30509:+ [translate_table: standard]
MAASRVLLILVAAAASAVLLQTGKTFVGVSSTPLSAPAPKVILAAESSSSSGFSLAEYPENDENVSSASIVFWFVFGLLTPLLGGFTFGLILAAVGWGLSTGGIKSFVEKSESTKQFAEYVTTMSDIGKKGGEYGLKAYNFVAKKSKELTK